MPTKVLLIDDEAVLRETTRLMLNGIPDLDIIDAADGAVGVSLYREHRPDLVITDIMMPVKNGLDTIREIRAMNADARIIALSGGGGGAFGDPLSQALEAGAFAVIEKPFRKARLVDAVTRALERQA